MFNRTEKGDYMAKFLEFVLEDQAYAILVDSVRKVSQLHSIVRIPQTPNYVLGVTNYGDQLITVIDLKFLLGIPKVYFAKRQLTINVFIGNSFYALLADDVLEVIDVNLHNAKHIETLNFKFVILNK